MKIGDLVRIINSDNPFFLRPGVGVIGIIVEIRESNWLGKHYYVYVDNVGWRYYESELELINDGSG